MKENKKDLYPNLGLSDIIKILHDKDRGRLAREDFSDCEVEIVSNLSYKDDGILTMILTFIMETLEARLCLL